MLNLDPSTSLWRRIMPIVGAVLLLHVAPASARDFNGIEDEIEALKQRIKDRVAERVEQRVKKQVQARVRQSVEETIDDTIADQLADLADTAREIEIEVPESSAFQPRVEEIVKEIKVEPEARARIQPADDIVEVQIDNRIEAVMDDIELTLQTVSDSSSSEALAEEWLVLSDENALRELEAKGFVVTQIEPLAGLGYLMSTVRAPATYDPSTSIASIEVINNQQIVMDLNHVYLPQRDNAPAAKAPFSNATSTATVNAPDIRLGMIDSSINLQHEVFADATIAQQRFTPKHFKEAAQHGTAIASIMVGKSNDFQGAAAGSSLYNGVVFAIDDQGREFSTTAAIVRAINWLVEQDVKLINMSLAGPHNAILARAVDSACGKGTTLISAVGNAGPASPPLYPAAYDCTIAVTAVDQKNQAYHRANRGAHVDYALLGVNVTHATADGGYGVSSGTSYAAALLSGTIATLVSDMTFTVEEIRTRLSLLVKDIGPSGVDHVYGKGLVAPQHHAELSQ